MRLQIERKQMCALYSCIENLGNFHVFLKLKPKSYRALSSRGELVYSRSAKEFDRISFDPLSVGMGKT
jgi:hypothetical protein